MMQLHITNCVKPRSRPSRLRSGANPQSPGFHRPQVKHRSSLTPTRLPHDGQTTDPHFCLNMSWDYDGTAAALRAANGNLNVNTAPEPRPALAASIEPLCSSTRCRTIERPSPKPDRTLASLALLE